MGKRSEFEKKPRDKYYTIDPDAVKPILSKLKEYYKQTGKKRNYAEPCAGAENLINLLSEYADCIWTSDIDPQNDFDTPVDVMDLVRLDFNVDCDLIITNPPYTKKILMPMIEKMLTLTENVWLLLPADMMHNQYMSRLIDKHCISILSVGRLYWEAEKKVKGKDNYEWYFFKQHKGDFTPCCFTPREIEK